MNILAASFGGRGLCGLSVQLVSILNTTRNTKGCGQFSLATRNKRKHSSGCLRYSKNNLSVLLEIFQGIRSATKLKFSIAILYFKLEVGQ
jgi:hypothetical protein